MGSITETILQETQDYITAERKSLQDAKGMADTTTQAEIARLRSQNVMLSRALEAERAKAERAKDELAKKIISLFDTFTAERGRSLQETFSELTDSNAAAEAGMVKLGKDQGQRLDSIISRGKELSGSLDKRGSESKRLRDGGLKVCTIQELDRSTCLTIMSVPWNCPYCCQGRLCERAFGCIGVRNRLLRRPPAQTPAI